MAEDATRRLLRVFGIAVTECEDALDLVEVTLRDQGPGAASGPSLEAYERAARELETRWTEVERLIQGYQSRARAALLAGLRTRGVA
ncbi:MAG TPA: hypothetical protein VHO73_06960 [Methylomirabilota bacterium]|jgi:hypothetical protein|nr:hypothetical protein [Methylomirabilota bacterium]